MILNNYGSYFVSTASMTIFVICSRQINDKALMVHLLLCCHSAIAARHITRLACVRMITIPKKILDIGALHSNKLVRIGSSGTHEFFCKCSTHGQT